MSIVNIRSTDLISGTTNNGVWNLTSPISGDFILSWYKYSDLPQPWIWSGVDTIVDDATATTFNLGELNHTTTAATAIALQTIFSVGPQAGTVVAYNPNTNAYDITWFIPATINWSTNVLNTAAPIFLKTADEIPSPTTSLPAENVLIRPAMLEVNINEIVAPVSHTRSFLGDFLVTMDSQVIQNQRVRFGANTTTINLQVYFPGISTSFYPVKGLWDIILTQ